MYPSRNRADVCVSNDLLFFFNWRFDDCNRSLCHVGNTFGYTAKQASVFSRSVFRTNDSEIDFTLICILTNFFVWNAVSNHRFCLNIS